MRRKQPLSNEALSEAFIEEVCVRVAQNQRVRRTLPGGGRLNLDRRLPFLCVYRQPATHADAGTKMLVNGEAAFLVASAEPAYRKRLSNLVRRLAETVRERFGAFLIVEVWSVPPADYAEEESAETGEPILPHPEFRVVAPAPRTPYRTVTTLSNALQRIRVHKWASRVNVDFRGPVNPPGLPAIISAGEAKRLGCYLLGLEVLPIFRDAVTGETFPAVLRTLRRGLGRALKRAFFAFAQTRTNINPQHYYALGRRKLVKAVWRVDQLMADVSNQFDFLLQVTPINSERAWNAFRRSRFEVAPRFEYRPLAAEPTLLKRWLFEIPIERIEDPTIAHIFRQRQDELDRRITMLGDVESSRFLQGSLQVYGGVDAGLLTLAEELLEALKPHSRDDSPGGQLNAEEFAERARAEIEYYQNGTINFGATVSVRDDLFSGLLSTGGNLLIGNKTMIPARRADALLQHEVGTHLLTYYNGRAQPLQLLYTGLAGYESLQEGLAVLSEYLAGGLSRPRLRLLAARVVAVHRLIEGASFLDTFHLLDKKYRFAQRLAYTITMRVYRSGGLTKDAIYLRGLVKILDYLGRGGELEPLFVGKMAVDHVPVIQELLHRRVLRPAPLRPRYMDMPQVSVKLSRLAQGLSVLDLTGGAGP